MTKLKTPLQKLSNEGLISDFNREVVSNAGADVAFTVNPEAQVSCEMAKVGVSIESYKTDNNSVSVSYGLQPRYPSHF